MPKNGQPKGGTNKPRAKLAERLPCGCVRKKAMKLADGRFFCSCGRTWGVSIQYVESVRGKA